MKNSAWYTKLWRKKLDKLPVKGDAGAAWANMQQMLDAHLPVSGMPGASPVAAKSVVAKIVSMAAYVLPAAAMVGAVTWYAVKPSGKQKITSKPDKHKEFRLKADSMNQENNLVADSVITAERIGADSMNINNGDTVAYYADDVKKNSLLSAKNELSENSSKANPNKKITGDNLVLGKHGAAEKVLLKGSPITSGGNSAHGPDRSTAANKRIANGAVSLGYKSAGKRGNNRVPFAYSAKLEKGNIHPRRNNIGRINNNGTLSNWGVISGSGRDQKGNAAGNRHKAETTKELHNYLSPSLGFGALPVAQNTSALYISKDVAGVLKVNNSLLLPDYKSATVGNSNVNKFADSQSGKVKYPKNKIPKDFNTPLYNWGLEAGLNLNNGTGWYVGIAADYALTNRLLIGAGLRLTSGSKIKGSYAHPSFFRPDSAAAFTITEERKISAIQVPFNFTYKVSDLISLKAGAVINFAGNPGSASYTLGPVGGFRDTLRRTKSIDTAVAKSVLAGKVSLGFTGGVSLNFKKFSVDARYLVLPPYKVNNPLGNYSSSNNAFQIGVTYRFGQGSKKQLGRNNIHQ